MDRKKLLLVAATLLLLSCRHEEIIINVTPSAPWKNNTNFSGLHKIKINSLTTEDKLYLYGPRSLSVVTSDNLPQHYLSSIAYPEFYRLPISEKYFVQIYNNSLLLANTRYPNLQEGRAAIDFSNLDPTFKDFNLGRFYQSGFIQINQADQCLVPIQSSSFDESTLYLFGADVIEKTYVTIKDTTKISISLHEQDYIRLVRAIEDFFIVSYYDRTFKIYNDGPYKKTLDAGISNMFQFSNTLYGIKDSNLYISEDLGESWSSFTGFPEEFSYANYFNLGDSLVATVQSKMFAANFNSDNYSFKELNNEGLEGNEITSLANFGDSIYVSTYTGVFTRHKDDFFEYKNQ